MTSKTIVRAGLVAAGALTAAVLAGTAAQAAGEHRNPGMERMHELMQEGNSGMERMHERMHDGNPDMHRMHQRMQEHTSEMPGMIHMGPATR
jgi:hypothetical protein